ncbi:MAG: MFS transporter [Christensenellales bacterium]|jgi:predicted MFS family arabinose efflux permease
MPKGKRIPLFLMSIVLYWFSFFSYMPILTEYLRTFSTTQMAGAIVGIYGLMQVIFRIPIGMLSDKLKKRRLFVTGACALFALASLGLSLIRQSYWALLFRALGGIAVSTWVPYAALFSSYYKDGKGAGAIGLMNTFNFSGQMLGTFLGGYAVQLTGDMRSAFFIGILTATLCFGLSFFIVDQRKEDFPDKPEPFRKQLSVLKDKTLLWTSILCAVSQMPIFGGVYGFTPTFAVGNAGADASQLGIMSTLIALMAILGSFVSPRTPRLFKGMENCFFWTFAVFGAYAVIVPFVKSVWIFYLLHLVFGFFRGMSASQTMDVAIRHIHPARRGTAMGFFQAIYGIGISVAPYLVGLFGRSGVGETNLPGLTLGFFVVAAMQAVGAVLSLTVMKKHLHAPVHTETTPA